MRIEQVGDYLVCEFNDNDIREAYDFIINNFDEDVVDEDVHKAFEFWTKERVEHPGSV
jgi:hypothetical protein